MSKLYFYDVDKDYVSFLKKFEPKIPNISYSKHDKFVCGVVLKIDGINYFAPVSSYNIQKRTNVLIYNEHNKPISSIRFSFMFPAPDECIKIKDFSKEDPKYKLLLNVEYNYINKIADVIYDKAKYVYSIGCNKDHFLNRYCCDFKLLEEKYREYVNLLNIKYSEIEAAAIKDVMSSLEIKIQNGQYTPEDAENYNKLQAQRLSNTVGSIKNNLKSSHDFPDREHMI